MRQIKFRFWRQPYTTSISETGKPDRTEEIRGQMLYWPDTKFMINYQEKSLDLEAYLKGDTSPMQFTGLTDKNGKEIYEGDIVIAKGHPNFTDKKTVKGIIEWIKIDACFAVQDHSDEIFTIGRFEKKIEVIGNIHQNPELLK